MSNEETDLTVEMGNRIHQLRRELLELCRNATRYAYRMGQILKEIRDKGLWVEQYESFKAFYSDEEIALEESSVYRAIKMVELFPEFEELGQVPVSKVNKILPYVNDDNKEQLLEMAKSLSRGDLAHELSLMRVVSAEPKVEYLPKIYPCPVCHGVKGVSFDSLCHCGMTPRQVELISKAIEKIQFGGEEDENY